MQQSQQPDDGFARAVWGVVLAILAVVTAPFWFVGMMYTPLILDGGRTAVGVAATISGFIAFFGLVLSAGALLDLRAGRGPESYRRASIVRTGSWGVFLSVSAIILMVFLAFWLPTYGSP